MERSIGRILTHIYCLLHANEKIWQKYFLHHEGLTKSPSYDGPIGSQLKNGLKLEPIVNYEPVPGFEGMLGWAKNFPKDFIDSFNNDTAYLYQLYLAIMEGPSAFSKSLAERSPGDIHQVKISENTKIHEFVSKLTYL